MRKLLLLLILIPSTSLLYGKKIVGLVGARNEEAMIEGCLRSLACYTDAIVFLDDFSTDKTLEIAQSLAQECNIEIFITKEKWHREEGKDRQKMLAAGRSIGGTHFVSLDADEMFTATCMNNNFLRNKILSLNKGDWIRMRWIDLWRSIDCYRTDDSPCGKNHYHYFIFCDDGRCNFDSQTLHTLRIPGKLKGKEVFISGDTYGVLHFQYVNWSNLLLKQAWYRCLEHVKQMRPPTVLNKTYGFSKNEDGLQTTPSPKEWFDYPFFNPESFNIPDNWRKEMILDWFKKHGEAYFKPLDIWDIDWSH